MIVVIDIQHHGKPYRLRDRGASKDGITEVDYVRRYAWEAERILRDHASGSKVCVISDGHYLDRWRRADSIGADAFIASHVNASGSGVADRGEVYYDIRSMPQNGPLLAREIARELERRVPWPVKAKGCRQGDRAFSTIKDLKAVGICYEPCFLDGPRGPLLHYCGAMGAALAHGLLRWDSRRRGLG